MAAPVRESIIRKSVALPASMWNEIAEFRADNRIISETEAVRRLIETALRAIKAAQG
jgi:hypothetical protein